MEFDGLPKPGYNCTKEFEYVSTIITKLTPTADGFRKASITIGVLSIPIFSFSVYCLIKSLKEY